MVTDQQVRRLFKLIQEEKNFGIVTIRLTRQINIGCKKCR